MKSRETVLQLFWKKVEKGPSCWLWTGGLSRPGGYGAFFTAKRHGLPPHAHRFAYATVVGAIPDGMCVLHRCDNPQCVNPDHLFLGTHADNMHDMAEKGRASTHGAPRACERGHRITAKNSFTYHGEKRCRQCLVDTIYQRQTTA